MLSNSTLGFNRKTNLRKVYYFQLKARYLFKQTKVYRWHVQSHQAKALKIQHCLLYIVPLSLRMTTLCVLWQGCVPIRKIHTRTLAPLFPSEFICCAKVSDVTRCRTDGWGAAIPISLSPSLERRARIMRHTHRCYMGWQIIMAGILLPGCRLCVGGYNGLDLSQPRIHVSYC